jgi:cytochrome b subunit of formate dehydrogenase
MVLHWLLDLGRHLLTVFRTKPQIRRMRSHEVWQHSLLMVSFIVLVFSGFALRYSDGWLSRLFFGWRGGFELRGTIHRVSAVLFMMTVLWHLAFLVAAKRGREFMRDMMPERGDFRQFGEKLLYNLGRRPAPPRFSRFSYVEKAEYWALLWGTIVMIVTGLMLWFDNQVVHYVPKGMLDVALVVHFWEAWLATLAILIWHMYSTVFSPHVYPMNPSWITGTMPESMYKHEHPDHAAQARKETEDLIQAQIEALEPVPDEPSEAAGVEDAPDSEEVVGRHDSRG